MRLLSFALAVTVACCALVTTASASGGMSARVTQIIGKVQEKKSSRPSWVPTRLDSLLMPGDALRTGRQSRTQIIYRDGTITRLASATIMRLQEAETSPLRLLFGRIFMRVAKQSSPLQVKIPAGVASILGTEFLLSVEAQDVSHLTVLEGKVEMTGSLGDKVTLTKGQWVEIRPGEKMEAPTPFDWTILKKTEPLLREDGVDTGFEAMPWK